MQSFSTNRSNLIESRYIGFMETAPTDQHPLRGRPREFDEDAALDALTGLFWQKGYEATSINDIVRASGVNKSSLYNAYGSKQDLFCFVLSRYVDQRMQALAHLAENGTGEGVEPLHGFLDAMREFGRAGCLAVNTTTEIGTRDATVARLAQEYRDKTRQSIFRIISSVSQNCGLPVELVGPRADVLMAFLIGFSVAVRAGAQDGEVNRLIDAAHVVADSWLVGVEPR
jgi:TetR/AcrR family transcriptional regulator, copper-responsive repressor